jgi:asparagine synthase (glutamine-hydrolysing)
MDPAHGHQPMTSAAAAVVFNGEIYNDAELRAELRTVGCRFAIGSDTEVILRGFEHWGLAALLPRLNGMFAFAIHDVRSGELWLARDRTGQKPVYYVQRNGKLLFASEIKALLESELVDRKLNHAAVDQYLTLRYVPQPHTLLADVQVLPGGHYLHWQQAKLSVGRFWQPTVVAESRESHAELLNELDRLFDAAIQRTLRSDVPVGA